MDAKKALGWAGILGASSVLVLALAAHTLETKLDSSQLNAVKTAGNIQLFHSVALLGLGASSEKTMVQLGNAIKIMLIGTCLFSFSIYLIMFKSISGFEFLRFIWPVTPIGGLVLMFSWVMIFVKSRKLGKSN
jgi:uncharacterized membrane protein YgdD (TMEM256/DUF423 family)